jgi:hypothetical protein
MLLRATRSGTRLVVLAATALVVSVSPGLTGEFFEGFEDGTLGAMAPMNIDADKSSLDASDGYRCQYSDPDNPDSNSYGQITDCWLGATPAQAADFFWQVVGGGVGYVDRSYSGDHSVWMGAMSRVQGPNDPEVTAPLGTLEALVTAAPITLSSGKVCSLTSEISCRNDRQCPAGEQCVSVAPELSFKHQVSFPDYRVINVSAEGRSSDGGAVMVQVVNANGKPLGDWIKLTAYHNGYDQQREDYYTNCFFDPIDDGNTEDDFYEGDLRLGPSTLCYDQWVFAYLGDTDEPFDAANVGNAVGPGLQGDTGLGTWVESRFDLSEFRGKSILIRFLSSGIKVGSYETYEDVFGWNPTPADDGWWIDDIRVTGTVESTDALTPDDAASREETVSGGLRELQARPAPR